MINKGEHELVSNNRPPRRWVTAEQRNLRVIKEIAELGRPASAAEIMKKLGTGDAALAVFLSNCRYIPWLSCERLPGDRFVFAIDEPLRRLCELGRQQRGLGGLSIEAFLMNLRDEISRRRAANNAERAKRNWNVDAVLKIELVALLDWIEDELDKVHKG